jgi:hypothetical protein
MPAEDLLLFRVILEIFAPKKSSFGWQQTILLAVEPKLHLEMFTSC